MTTTALQDECDCTCHADPDSEADAHSMTCCMRCNHCGKRIEASLWGTHSDACAQRATQTINAPDEEPE